MEIHTVHASVIPQSSEDSIVDSSGRYDMTAFSDHEVEVVNKVLEIAASKKYPLLYKGLGLANESYGVVYKPRYILHELIILKYRSSINPFDQLAVAMAYRSKGTAFRNQAIQYYEKWIHHSSPLMKKRALIYGAESEPFFSYHLAELYTDVGDFKKAIKYAIRAERLNEMNLPAYPQLIAKIYKWSDIAACISYLDKVLYSQRYSDYSQLFQKELESAKQMQDGWEVYRPKEYRPSKRILEFEASITSAAKEFLPGGKYYRK